VASRVKLADIYAALSVEGFQQFDGNMDKAEQRAKKAAEQIAKVGQALLGVGAALTGLAAIAVKAAVAEEDVKDQLDALYGSAEAGNRILGTMRGIADKTGISLQRLSEGVTAITTYFGDNEEQTKRLLGPLSDLAKYMGIDIPSAVSMLGRAYAGGASDTIALRGPVLALIKDYARLHYGITDISKMALPEFRAMLLKFLTDPMTKFAGHAEEVAKGLGGTFDRLKVKISEVSASFGNELAPSIAKVLDGLIRLLNWFGKLPEPIKAVAVGVGTVVGVIATLAGGLMTLLPRILQTVLALKAMAVSFSAAAAGAAVARAGLVGFYAAIIAGGVALTDWINRVKVQNATLDEQAVILNRLRDAAKKAKEGTAEWYEAQARWKQTLIDTAPALYDVSALEKEIADYRMKAAQLRADEIQRTTDLTEATKKLIEEQKKLTESVRQYLHVKEVGQKQAEWEEATKGIEALPISEAEKLEYYRQKFNDIFGDMADVASQDSDVIAGSIEDTTFDIGQVAGKCIDWLGALQQTAGAAGQSLGTMFADMAKGAEVHLGKVIASIAKLIAKLLIMVALYQIPGVGPILAQFAGGFLGAVGFDNPVPDTQAFRWGFDFARNFHEGLNSMVSGGLGLPQLQPATISGISGAIAFDVHVHEPGPDTYVKVVRRGVAQMDAQDRLGLMRLGLGRAYDDWSGR